MRPVRLPLAVLCLSALLLAGGCGDRADRQASRLPVSETYFIFDTIVQIRVYDESFPEDRFGDIGAILERIDARLNRNESGTEIGEVNRNAGIRPVAVSEETFAVVKKALEYAEWSKGRFDPTIGPLVDLWGIGTERAAVPAEEDIGARLALVDYRNVELDEAARTVFLKKAGMSLDLGAIGKGYAADVIAEYLRDAGIGSAILDLGGNLVALGEKPDGSPWAIGIQDPAGERGEHLGIVRVKDRTLVSSGVYERYFEQDGQTYHHILDPETGWPVDNELLAVTIVTGRSEDADALSTSVFAMGLRRGLETVEALEDAEAVFVTKDNKLYVTSGLKETFTLTNEAYAPAD